MELNTNSATIRSMCKVQILEQLSGNSKGSTAQLCGCCGLNVIFLFLLPLKMYTFNAVLFMW